MSIAESCNLTRLLRLLTDVASAAEAQQLRASMRENEALKQQHDRLIQVMTQPFLLGNSLLHLDQIDPEIVAAFIDGGLQESERTAFEQQCWNSDSLLREVATGWRIEHDPNAAEPLSLTGPSNSNEYPAVTEDSQAHEAGVATVSLRDDPVPEIEIVSLGQQKKRQGTQRQYRAAVLGFVTAAVLAAALLVAWKWIARAEKLPGGPDPDRVVQQDKQPQNSTPQELVQDDGAPKQDQEDAPKPDREMEVPEARPSNEVIVEVPDVKPAVPDAEPGRRLGPGILLPPLRSRINLANWLDWSKVQGIAATKDASRAKWRGIEVPSNYAEGDAIPWVQVATLPKSQLKGEDGKGAKWTVDANTNFKISQRAASPKGVVVCDLASGRLAIEKLGLGRTVYVCVNQEEYPIVVDKADTTCFLQRVGQDMVLGVFTGSMTFDGSEVDRYSWRRIDMAGKAATFRPKEYDAWYNDDLKKEEDVPATLRNALNNAPDFLAQVIDVSRNGTPAEQVIGFQAILRVSAAGPQTPTDAALRKMMGSQNEDVREALVEWLVVQCKQNPRLGLLLVKRVARLQNVPADQTKMFEGWFSAVARGNDYNNDLLTQFARSLTNQSLPVVRQTAKFFLEDYLGDDLPYNATKPGGNIDRVINEIRKKVAEKQRKPSR